MTKRFFLCALVVIFLTQSCKSVSIPQQIPETMRAACDLYTKIKPLYLKARAWAAAHWDQVPEDIKPVLIELDSYGPKLDNAGQLLCAGSTAIDLTVNGKTTGLGPGAIDRHARGRVHGRAES